MIVVLKSNKPKLNINLIFSLGVSIAVRKYLVTSRTQKSSSFAAKVVLGGLSVRIARRSHYFYIKRPTNVGLFFCLFSIVLPLAIVIHRHNMLVCLHKMKHKHTFGTH